MDKFIVEKFVDGDMVQWEVVECDQRLLNEIDLGTITIGKERGLLFVRSSIDTTCGYYLEDDDRWTYGQRERAINVIKRRIS